MPAQDPSGAPAQDGRSGLQRRTLGVLMVAILPAGAAMSAGYGSAAILGEELTGNEALGGLAAAAMTTGAALSAVPLARLMAARGRRPGLTCGYAIAAVGALLATAAALSSWYPLLVAGILGIGTGNAANLAARFAAADLAEEDDRAQAIGSLIWASTFGTVLGPTIGLGPAPAVAEWMGLPPLAGPYVLCVVLFGAAGLLVWRRLLPDPLAVVGGVGLPAAERPRFWDSAHLLRRSAAGRLGVLGMVSGHVVMVAIMTMTPLHLRHGGHHLEVVGFVISLHIIGMYAFSPVVGRLADRLGERPVLVAGGVLLLGGALWTASTGEGGVLGVYLGLFLIGLGWSCGIVAGSSLLVGAFPPARRVQVQGLADLVMTAAGAAAGLTSGFVVAWTDYGVLARWSGVLGLSATAVVIIEAVGGRRSGVLRP
ncbi:MAG: MFS transporter [Acidimicrobiales bacterium]|nr:MFS transporter [Acidimicrobiales bacterium]